MEPIVLGTTLPLSGPLREFGTSLEAGYRLAVEEANAAGVRLGRARLPVRLLVRDNQTDPNRASQQARELVADGAAALLGPATPPLSIPVSVVAEQVARPCVVTMTPIRAWQSACDAGWSWAWDFFFDEQQMTRTQFQAADLVETNRRVALFTDLEEDGIVMGALWEQHAREFGYEVVYRAEFPVGLCDFSSQVDEAQAAEADVAIAQVMPPDGVAILRAMADAGYCPKLLFIEKTGNTGGWPRVTGGLGEGTLAANWWSPELGLQRSQEFVERFREELGGIDSNLASIVWGYSAARLLLDAVERAGALDPAAVNAEIGRTDGEYPAGHVRFDSSNTCALPAIMTQWHGSDMVLVMLADGSPGPHALRVPPSGLAKAAAQAVSSGEARA
jgi:branched-chain amino acid transport system substrate-binding protein